MLDLNVFKVKNKGVVYQIPCDSCDKKKYVGETDRGIDARLREHET